MYFASKLSENISQTPEGYLICRNVPISRTGTQEYLASELGIEDVPGDKMVEVHRSESEVFSPAALASFEGKPLTDEHPPENVSPDNVSRLLKGVCNNVRRGEGDDSDKVISEVIAYDPILISEILRGKRGISCGYDCDYEFDESGRIHQRNIRGNHVAVVTAGRAGSDVAIHDKAPEAPEVLNPPEAPDIPIKKTTTQRRKPHMSKPNNKGPVSRAGLIGRLFPMVAKDADPEAVAEVMEELAEALAPAPEDEAPAPAPAESKTAESPADPPGEQMPGWAKSISDRLDAIDECLKGMNKPEDADPLEELERELSGGDNEESVTVKAEELGGEVEAGPADEDPKGAGTHQQDSRAEVLAALRQAKPAIAAIKDPAQRKTVSDSLAKVLRASMGIKPGGGASYSAIIDAKQDTAKEHKTRDKAVAEKTERTANLGQDLAKKFNPHYRDKK